MENESRAIIEQVINGNPTILYPETKAEYIHGLNSLVDAKIAALNDHLTEKIEEAKQEVEQDVQEDISDLSTQVTDMGTQVSEMGTSVSNMETQVSNMGTQVSSLSTQVTNLNTKVSSRAPYSVTDKEVPVIPG